jgi:hypothetical protein
LHDCGKVTTPEYIVDKATKLETLYDRIHEIRMRFEVMKRDAEIACWQAIANGGNTAELKEKLIPKSDNWMMTLPLLPNAMKVENSWHQIKSPV